MKSLARNGRRLWGDMERDQTSVRKLKARAVTYGMNPVGTPMKFDIALLGMDDAPEFFAAISRLLHRAAHAYDADRVSVFSIKRWFGERWLGFRGKVVGALGVRCNIWSEKLSLRVPPFHPNRIKLGLTYRRGPRGYKLTPEVALNPYAKRSSESNTRLLLCDACGPGLYAWFTSGTRKMDRGSIMVYHIHPDGDAGWFVGFARTSHWQPTHRVGIGDPEWRVLWGDDIASEGA